MKMRSKTTFVFAICTLLVLAAISIAVADPALVWQEEQKTPNILGGGRGNIYYGGGVIDNTFYTAQMEFGPMQWAMSQTNGTAMINCLNANTASLDLGKSCTKVGKWLFVSKATHGLIRMEPWNKDTIVDLSDSGPESCITDGTYLYTNNYDIKNVVCKYQVNENGSVTKLWSTAITGSAAIRLRGLSYYNGKIYVVDHNADDRGVYEIDAVTGTYSRIATYPAFSEGMNAYQVVRYGNQIFGVGLDDKLQVWEFNGTVWNLTNTYDLGLDDEYGIGVAGDGTKAQYLWITSKGSKRNTSLARLVSFWALDPMSAPEKKLGDAKNQPDGAFYTIKDMVVSFAGNKEFFAQDKNRSSGIRVKWDGTLPAKNTLVSVAGVMSTSEGERYLQAIAISQGGEYKAKPIGMPTRSAFAKYQHGSAGLANDGLLVTVWGRITAVDWNDFKGFYLDDGSKVTNNTPVPDQFIYDSVPGIRVVKYDSYQIIYPDITYKPYVSATGIVRMQVANGQTFPVLYLRDDEDVRYIAD